MLHPELEAISPIETRPRSAPCLQRALLHNNVPRLDKASQQIALPHFRLLARVPGVKTFRLAGLALQNEGDVSERLDEGIQIELKLQGNVVMLGTLREKVSRLLELLMCVRDWALALVVHIRVPQAV